MTELARDRPRVLPPKGLLIALTSQVPLVFANFPLRPSITEMVIGAACIAC